MTGPRREARRALESHCSSVCRPDVTAILARHRARGVHSRLPRLLLGCRAEPLRDVGFIPTPPGSTGPVGAHGRPGPAPFSTGGKLPGAEAGANLGAAGVQRARLSSRRAVATWRATPPASAGSWSRIRFEWQGGADSESAMSSGHTPSSVMAPGTSWRKYEKSSAPITGVGSSNHRSAPRVSRAAPARQRFDRGKPPPLADGEAEPAQVRLRGARRGRVELVQEALQPTPLREGSGRENAQVPGLAPVAEAWRPEQTMHVAGGDASLTRMAAQIRSLDQGPPESGLLCSGHGGRPTERSRRSPLGGP